MSRPSARSSAARDETTSVGEGLMARTRSDSAMSNVGVL
jgi:hypothetical protein